MKLSYRFSIVLIAVLITTTTQAKDRLKLDTTIIKGNTEMPQIVYIVPWKDTHQQAQKEQTLVLHSLFGDLFDPVNVDAKFLKK